MNPAAAQPEIRPVYAVVPPRALLLDLAGPLEVLRKANQLQDRIRYVVHPVGASAAIGSSVGLTVAGLAPLPETLPAGAAILLCGQVDVAMTAGDTPAPPADPDAEAAIVRWLKAVAGPETVILSICSGALFAAKAGLLDGHDCTTHFSTCAALGRLVRGGRVLENRLFVVDRNRLTSAGVTAGIDLMLHVVARALGGEIASAIARYLVVYARRAGTDPQLSPWLEGRNHVHPAVHRAQDAIAADPARDWRLDALARLAGASPRHLSRLFKENTGFTVPDYVNRLRVTVADEMMKAGMTGMERVAAAAGFSSSRHLRRVWRQFHATPPSVARESAI